MSKYTVSIQHDPDCESPVEDCCNWRLYSFSSRHRSFKHPEHFFDDNRKPKLWLRNKLRVGLAFLLSYFEHGDCVWSLRGTGPQCPWDSVDMAGVAVWEHKPGDIGAKTVADRAKDCANFLETYTSWCNGECYYYSIDSEDGSVSDCCGGFIGEDVARGVLESMPKDATDENTTVEGCGFDSYDGLVRIAKRIERRYQPQPLGVST